MSFCRITDMRHKEVINSKNGCRLGYADDVEIDTHSARLVSVIIFGRPKLFGLLGHEDDIVIRWENIELIGEDTILVKNCPPRYNKRKIFPSFLFRNKKSFC